MVTAASLLPAVSQAHDGTSKPCKYFPPNVPWPSRFTKAFENLRYSFGRVGIRFSIP